MNWMEKRRVETELEDDCELAVLILGESGSGQAGLTAAARLKMLGVNSLIIDQNDRVGDNWRKRYHHLVLHDPVWYDHMPYVAFPPQWPIFTPKDKLAQFFEAYVDILELNVWLKSTATSSKWDKAKGMWTVTVERRMDDGSTQTRTLRVRHIIQATGHSGQKNEPQIKGAGTFKGDRICHSSEFPGAQPSNGEKRAVIVGSCNSGHDIAQDFFDKGYDVTIVQRSSTCVVSSRGITDILLKGLYVEGGPPVDDADMLTQSLPNTILKALHCQVVNHQKALDRDTTDGLKRAGFKVNYGPDEAGLFFNYLQRGGGYYIDVGTSKLIADGSIKVRQGLEVSEILPDGIRLADGSELQADEVVLATGYDTMESQTRVIFGDEVADRVCDVWGFNKEGEMRTIWQQSGHPGFWFHAGNLALCRYYSKLLALQIKGLEKQQFVWNGDQEDLSSSVDNP
ncbi:pyridine nucleotide-disulfide oxidoreductase [Hirsutella rhossiliensis]|uniref:Pyridine nucleotide-disulfide oxidoreductase domain-containing protein n=1 Tax=Hirsutella rhossiliensis TaxID=111463 RepID=A0A9P8MUL0_9HYPO|nr:pyridine nucleotide-disulfide oxidoreductase domain-containing protein [Hirsutella rhossiliensis]KAH0961682.1 pyridine nucleotide-disulfide oxidoreductase domain-containing protein [Hirsutella rhossiliensis]